MQLVVSRRLRALALAVIVASACGLITLPARPAATVALARSPVSLLPRSPPPRAVALLGQLQPTLRAAAAAPSRASAVRMEDAPFWPNIERFARFFISTITGLIFGLLSPLAAFGRSPLLALVGTSLVLGTLAFFYFTLTSMQSPEFTPPSVIPDQSVQQMMDEIYGPR